MTKKVSELIAKSERALKAAHRQIEAEDYDFAVSRIYYAMFYVTEAALLTKDLSASKHSGVLALFNRHFIQTGVFDRRFHRLLSDAFDLRQQGDYWADSGITKDTAENLEKEALNYVSSIRNYLERLT